MKPGMIILEEETFGPVAPIVKFETEVKADRTRQRQRIRPRQRAIVPRHRR
jgi:acyl-CoA reductase-like NAD-dependent aldehyde dehydrogenase